MIITVYYYAHLVSPSLTQTQCFHSPKPPALTYLAFLLSFLSPFFICFLGS